MTASVMQTLKPKIKDLFAMKILRLYKFPWTYFERVMPIVQTFRILHFLKKYENIV